MTTHVTITNRGPGDILVGVGAPDEHIYTKVLLKPEQDYTTYVYAHQEIKITEHIEKGSTCSRDTSF